MLSNYLKIALRTLWKNKGFGFINIAGLAMGISTCILIAFYVLDESGYDTFHTKADRIYRLTEILHMPKENRPQAVTSPPMAPALKENFPEIEKTVRLSRSSRSLAYQDKKMYDTKIWYADSSLFEIFTFPMIKGNPKTALVNPYSIVLTEQAAKKYFGEDDALGKLMTFSDTIALTVTGIIKNIPSNSHLQFDVMLSRSTITEMTQHQPEDNWFNNGYYTYVLLREGYNVKNLEAKFRPYLDKKMAEEKRASGLWYDFVLQPLTDIHLKSNMSGELGPNGNIKYVYIFSVVAIMVLLIACANYVNLSTARAMNRAKELGLRRVIGAKRQQLIVQLLGESFLTTFISSLLAVVVISAALPAFNTLTAKEIGSQYLMTPGVVAVFILVFLTISVLAGAYPAFLMSSYSPIKSLKYKIWSGGQNSALRRGLVVVQFTISIILIVGTIVIFHQMDFLKNKKIGLEKEQVVELKMRTAVISKYQLIKDEMMKVPGVTMATATDFSYSNGLSSVSVLPEGAQENEISSETVISVDYDFLKTFKIEMLAGRDFTKESSTDAAEGFIVNEAAVKHFNWKSAETAIGKKIDWGLGKKGKVVGVVRDFNFFSLHSSVKPLIIHIKPDWYRFIVVKIGTGQIEGTINGLETAWKKLNLDSPFDYSFLDKDFEKLYKAEEQTQTIIGLLSTLAIFIACLGLFGLAAFTAEQRTKEIGVRKVLGANVMSLVGLLSNDFLRLVMVAIVLAIPVAWFAMNKWLDGFAYRIEISWWVFIAAGFTSIAIALFAVSFQSIKAALANPVDSLRSE